MAVRVDQFDRLAGKVETIDPHSNLACDLSVTVPRPVAAAGAPLVAHSTLSEKLWGPSSPLSAYLPYRAGQTDRLRTRPENDHVCALVLDGSAIKPPSP